jgi:hypothetical protein
MAEWYILAKCFESLSFFNVILTVFVFSLFDAFHSELDLLLSYV